MARRSFCRDLRPSASTPNAQLVTPLSKSHLLHSTAFVPPTLQEPRQPANSLEFELVRQIADAQWRMRRLTRLETGFLAAAVDDQHRHLEKRRRDELRPGYDGETLLLGSAMLDRTQAFVHLARYDGHLSRRFFRAVKQLRDLRRDEREAHEARSSASSHAPADPYRSRYVPAQAPPPIDPPSPTANHTGFRASRDSAPRLAGDRHPGGTFLADKAFAIQRRLLLASGSYNGACPQEPTNDQTKPISPNPREINAFQGRNPYLRSRF